MPPQLIPLPLDSALFWLLAIAGVVMTGISKSGFAGGAGVVAVPLLALVMPLPQAVVLMLPLLLAMDVKTISYYRNSVDRRELRAILPAALAGIAAGGLLMGMLSNTALQLILGLLCVVFALWQQLAPHLGRMRGGGWFWGGMAGLTSTLIHAGGPPINIYLLARQLPRLTWLATAGVFFGAMNVVKIIPYVLVGQWHSQLLLISLLLLPAAWFGVKLGHIIQQHISESGFMLTCRVLLLGSGCLLLVKSANTL